jgi:hypothetical protein
MTAPSPDSIRELRAEIQKTLDLVDRQRIFYRGFLDGDLRRLGLLL